MAINFTEVDMQERSAFSAAQADAGAEELKKEIAVFSDNFQRVKTEISKRLVTSSLRVLA